VTTAALAREDAGALRRAPACVLTFDVEEWFHTENLRPVCPRAAWDRLPQRAPEATRRVLDFLGERDLRATFFVLGLVAEQHPELVRAIAEAGHEVACHGHGHVLPSQLTAMEFRDDVLRARKLLQDLSGQPVPGYRAPSFCLERSHMAILAGCGFEYDSSYHPVRLHDRYARFDWLGPAIRPGIYPTGEGLVELALPVERVGPVELSAAGGGYFRLLPYLTHDTGAVLSSSLMI
jgi:polysaccharide deacetylase family protein (PEP-CTERM system associated)